MRLLRDCDERAAGGPLVMVVAHGPPPVPIVGEQMMARREHSEWMPHRPRYRPPTLLVIKERWGLLSIPDIVLRTDPRHTGGPPDL